MSTPEVATAQRIVAVDLLRGAALFGILAVNCWYFASSWLHVGLPDPDYASGADRVAYGLVTLLFATKSYVLFAFLFGVSFVLQEQAADRAQAAFGPRMRRRLVGLMVLGLLHGILLFPGDILLTYGILGFFLLLMRRTPVPTLVRRGVGLTLAAAAIMLGLGVLVWLVDGGAGITGEDAAEAAALLRGSPADVLAANASEYAAALASILFVQGLPALGAMLVGMAAARARYFDDSERWRRDWRRVRFLAPTIGLIGAVIFTSATFTAEPGPLFVAFAVTTVTAPFLTATYVAGLLSWLQRSPGNRVLRGVAAAGRLALTNYLAQSVILALLFTGYGLALMDQVTATQTVAIVVAIYSVQVLVSAWWAGRHRYGPAEWLLRRWTYRASR